MSSSVPNLPGSLGDLSDREIAVCYIMEACSDAERTQIESHLATADEASASLRAAVESLEQRELTIPSLIEMMELNPEVRRRLVARASTSKAAAAERDATIDPVWRRWNKDEDVEGSLYTLRASDGDWEPTGVDGVRVRRLFVDSDRNRMTVMFQMDPGTSYPQHIHDEAEECYVISGHIDTGRGILGPGDYQRAAPGSLHGVQSTEDGCTILVTCSLHDEQTDD